MYGSGLISELQYAILTCPPVEANASDRIKYGLSSLDEPRNLLEHWKVNLNSQPNPEALANTQLFVNKLEEIASSHDKSSPMKTAANTQGVVNIQVATKSYADAISNTTVDVQSVMNVLEALASHSQNKSSSCNAS